jgi:hypothetical protein
LIFTVYTNKAKIHGNFKGTWFTLGITLRVILSLATTKPRHSIQTIYIHILTNQIHKKTPHHLSFDYIIKVNKLHRKAHSFMVSQRLISLATKHNWKIHWLDVKTAFLNGDLKEEVYLVQPEGFIKKV